MSLQNPKLFGYELDAALLDVADKPLALRRLNLPPFDLEVIRGSANAGMISNDWRSFSRLSVPLVKTLDRFERETGRYMNLMDQRAGTNIILSGNLNVNGSISGKAIRYNYVKFPETGSTANSEVKIADISTSRVSAWSSSDARATNPDLTIQENASISYGAQVGIATASGELVFGAQGSAKTVDGITYNDSLGPRLQTTLVPENKEFQSESPTHKIKVKLGTTDVWLYAMKGIPYTLKGTFKSFEAIVKLTALKGGVPASWKVVETGNANKYVNFANKQSGLESKINFSSPSVRERFIQFYYDPDYIETLTITSAFIEEIPEIRLANALSFNLASNKITILPDFNFLTPILTTLIISSNELHKTEIQGEKFFNPAVVAKLPSTIVNLTMGNTFNGSIRGQTTGGGDGSGAGGNGDYSETGGTYTAKDLIVRRFPDLASLNLNGGTRKFHKDNVDDAYIPNIPDTCTDYTIANNQLRDIGTTRADNGSNTSHFPNGSFNIKEAPNLETLDVQNNHDLTDNSFQIGSSVIKTVNMHNTNLRLPDMKAKLFLTDFNATWCRNAYSLFATQSTSGAGAPDFDANLKNVMSGYKFDGCNELTTLNLSHADLKNDRMPVFTNLKLTTLNLYETGIKGGAPGGNEDKVIPENTFANCPSLTDINITSDNLLSSEIAQYAFINCTELSSLCYNSKGSTSGNLPDFTANGQLRSLKLGGNNFKGGMPSFSGSPLINYVNLSDNILSGNIPGLQNLTNLRDLYLYNNNFTTLGTFSNLGALYRFEAHNNNLGGVIPDFSGCANLYYLILFNNNFDSYTSGSFAELRRVKYIDLANNNLGQQAIGAIVDDMYSNYQNYGAGRKVTINLRGNGTPSPETQEIILILREARWTVTFD